jgi:chromosomal replication initiation ATPase DnaA
VLAEEAQQYPTFPAVTDIIRICAFRYGLDESEFKKADRRTHGRIVRPRAIAMWVACAATEMSLQEIARRFGGVHHSTVMAARDKVNLWRATEPYLDRELTSIRESVQQAASITLPLTDVVSLIADALRARGQFEGVGL